MIIPYDTDIYCIIETHMVDNWEINYVSGLMGDMGLGKRKLDLMDLDHPTGKKSKRFPITVYYHDYDLELSLDFQTHSCHIIHNIANEKFYLSLCSMLNDCEIEPVVWENIFGDYYAQTHIEGQEEDLIHLVSNGETISFQDFHFAEILENLCVPSRNVFDSKDLPDFHGVSDAGSQLVHIMICYDHYEYELTVPIDQVNLIKFNQVVSGKVKIVPRLAGNHSIRYNEDLNIYEVRYCGGVIDVWTWDKYRGFVETVRQEIIYTMQEGPEKSDS